MGTDLPGAIARIRSQFAIGGYVVIASLAARAIILLGNIPLARHLGAEHFGLFALVQFTVLTLGALAASGGNIVIATHMAPEGESPRLDRYKLYRVVGIFVVISGAVIAVLASMVAILLHTEFGGREVRVPSLILMSIAIIVVALDSYQQGVLLATRRRVGYAVAILCAATIGMPVTICLTLLFGVEGALSGFGVSSLLQYGLSKWLASREFRDERAPLSRADVRRFGSFGRIALPGFISASVAAPVFWVVQIMLAAGSSTGGEVAQWSIGLQWYQVMMFVPAVIGRLVLPEMSSLFRSGDLAEISRMVRRYVLLIGILLWPIPASVFVLKDGIDGAYGADFNGVGSLIAIMTGTAMLVALLSPLGVALMACRRMWLSAALNIIWATVFISASYLLIDRGALGAGGAMLLAYLVHTVGTVISTSHALRIRVPAQTL